MSLAKTRGAPRANGKAHGRARPDRWVGVRAAPEDELEKQPVAEAETLKGLGDAVFVLDVRDADEMSVGGEQLSKSTNVPLNKAKGVNKTLDEFKADLEKAGVWATLEQRGRDAPIITHCGAGGRGGKACDALTKLGFTNVHNGGGPDDVRAARPDLG